MEWLRRQEKVVQRWVVLGLLFTLMLVSNTQARKLGGEEVTPTPSNVTEKPLIKVGILFPESVLRRREYQNKIRQAIRPFGGWLREKYQFTYDSFVMIQMAPNPSNATIQDAFDNFLSANVSAIIYPTVHQLSGPYTTSSQHFLELATNHSIPVIAWNADNSGLEKASKNGLVIQMAPTIHHQAAAMLSLLVKYGWHDFTIVTTEIDGHTDFVETIREQVSQYGDPKDNSKQDVNFTIIDHVLVKDPEECLCQIDGSRAHIFLLYSTHKEALHIMKKAEELQLTGKDFLWIVTESVIGDNWSNANRILPVGMLGVHFESKEEAHMRAVMASIRVFAYGVMDFLQDPVNDEGQTKAIWELGSKLHNTTKSLALQYYQCYDNFRKMGQTKYLPLEFLSDGTRKDVELKIMNFRKSQTTLANNWEEIGTWSSLMPEEVFIDGIVWPGDQSVPPSGNHPKGESVGDGSMADITGRIVLQQCLSASLNYPEDTEQSDVLDLQLTSDYVATPMATDSPQTEQIAEPESTKTIPSEFSSEIGKGMVVFVSFLGNASEETVNKLVDHITNVRLSQDGTGKRLSILDVQGDILIVPQATLGGNLKNGTMQYQRNVDKAFGKVLYDKLCQSVHKAVEEGTSGNVKCGVYGTRQRVNMDTDGPFTHIIQV